MFRNSEESHQHSLETLDLLYAHSSFMESIATVADLGCGSGLDIEWWATRTVDDGSERPLNIKCQGIDLLPELPVARKHTNMTYQCTNFEDVVHPPAGGFDILWSHDSFQYCVNPLETLKKWRDITSNGAMLAIILPQTTNIHLRNLQFTQEHKVYYHHTLVNLIHMLAVNGWDCRAGFFKKSAADPWIHAVVYKSETPPFDPRNTTWYDLVDAKLLPESADRSIMAKGYLDQNDLVLPWLNKSLQWLGNH